LQPFGCTRHQTSAYYPQSNGLVKHFDWQLKDALHGQASGPDCFFHLPWVMLGLRASAKASDSLLPPEILYSSELVLFGKFVTSSEPLLPTAFLGALQDCFSGISVRSLPATLPLPCLNVSWMSFWFVITFSLAGMLISHLWLRFMIVLVLSLLFFRVQVGDRVKVVFTA
jgi:hypothetical protein